jgi:hypothetical protein
MNIVRSHPLLAGIVLGVVIGHVFSGQIASVPGLSKIPQKS